MLQCPRCQSSEVRRTPVNASDFYYLLMLQRPYRCDACSNRFFRASWIGGAFLRAAFDDADGDADNPHDIHASSKPHAVNRRGWVRFLCNFDASCEANAADKAEQLSPGRVNDISRGGALLFMDHSLSEGTPLELRLDNAPEQAPWFMTGRVVHCQQRPEGDWAVGCRFDQRLSCEDLENLLASG